MTDNVLQSFCERCGTRYTFTAPEPKPAAKGGGGMLGRLGRRSSESVAEKPSSTTTAAPSSEQFEGTFHFCLDCRQYACTKCWNTAQGGCLSCRPLHSAEGSDAGSAATASAVGAVGRVSPDLPWMKTGSQSGRKVDEWGRPITAEPSSEPTVATAPATSGAAVDPWRDARFTTKSGRGAASATSAGAASEVIDFAAERGVAGEIGAWPDADRAPRAESRAPVAPVPAAEAPIEPSAQPGPEPINEPETEPAAASPVPEPQPMAEPESVPEPAAAIEPEPIGEPASAAVGEPEPATVQPEVAVEPEPEPFQPAAVIEPEPEAAVEPEPAAVAEPEPTAVESLVAQPEPEVTVQSEAAVIGPALEPVAEPEVIVEPDAEAAAPPEPPVVSARIAASTEPASTPWQGPTETASPSVDRPEPPPASSARAPIPLVPPTTEGDVWASLGPEQEAALAATDQGASDYFDDGDPAITELAELGEAAAAVLGARALGSAEDGRVDERPAPSAEAVGEPPAASEEPSAGPALDEAPSPTTIDRALAERVVAQSPIRTVVDQPATPTIDQPVPAPMVEAARIGQAFQQPPAMQAPEQPVVTPPTPMTGAPQPLSAVAQAGVAPPAPGQAAYLSPSPIAPIEPPRQVAPGIEVWNPPSGQAPFEQPYQPPTSSTPVPEALPPRRQPLPPTTAQPLPPAQPPLPGQPVPPAHPAMVAQPPAVATASPGRPVAVVPTTPGTRLCGSCGLSLSARARFCRRCGASQD